MKNKIVFILVVLLIVSVGFSKPSEATEIEFFHTFWVPEHLELLEGAIERYEEENPGINISETRVSWTDAPSQLMTSIMGGLPPDIVVANPSMVAQFRAQGAFAEITDMIPEDLKNMFLGTAMDIMTNQEGEIDGVGAHGANWALFYRKDLFEEAGLDPESPPENWEELLEYGELLTKDTNNDGNIDQWGYGWPVQAENATDYWENFLWQAGSEVIAYENGEWVPKFTEEEAIKGTQFMVDLVREYKISPVGLVDMDWEDVTNGFVEGDFAMMYNGAWVVDAVHDKGPELEGKWGTAPLYAGPAGRINRGHPNTFHILEASNVKQEAWEFLEFLYTEGRDDELSYVDEISVLSGALNWTDEFLEYAYENFDDLLMPFVTSYESARSPTMAPQWQNLADMYGVIAVQEMLMGDAEVEETLKTLNEQAEKMH